MENTITLSHGAGGRQFEKLLNSLFLKYFDNPYLHQKTDGAKLPVIDGPIVMSTDAHVASPLFFPGGDIGTLAFCGTVNDLSMMGAKPLYLSMSFIIEEGFKVKELKEIVQSIAELSSAHNIPIVTGDTKVVERGKGDGVFISTSGIGVIPNKTLNLAPSQVQEGQVIIASGTLGDHGATMISSQEHFQINSNLKSDCAPLHQITQGLLEAFPEITCLRDPTRGGLAAVLNEIAEISKSSMIIQESEIPLNQDVNAFCEMMGLDFTQLACEGRFIAFCPESIGTKVRDFLRQHPLGRDANIIGHVFRDDDSHEVSCQTRIGGKKKIPWPSGEQYPRIC